MNKEETKEWYKLLIQIIIFLGGCLVGGFWMYYVALDFPKCLGC